MIDTSRLKAYFFAMYKNFIDLHTHTAASDGSDRPADLVRKAAALRLAALAITDHDTLDGLDEAGAEAAVQGLEFVRGCEISSQAAFGELHFLGLWLPTSPARLAPLEAALTKIRAARTVRNRRIVEKLTELGLPVDYDAVLELTDGGVPGRPHIAQHLCQLGVTATIQEAFTRFLKVGAAAYVPREIMTPEQAVQVLSATGATVCMAHPGLCRCTPAELEKTIAQLRPVGLDALEAYHSEHSAQQERWCVDIAARYDLGLSGGSDYHGSRKPNVSLGKGKGRLRVTTYVLDKLKERRARQG